MDRLEEFLKELAQLTQKYGLAIKGCGCCGSPWIDDFKGEIDAEDLGYCKETQKYDVFVLRRTNKGVEER